MLKVLETPLREGQEKRNQAGGSLPDQDVPVKAIPSGAPLRFAALTGTSWSGFWLVRLIVRQKSFLLFS